MRYPVISKSRSACQIGDVLHMGRSHNAFVEDSNIHEKFVQRNVLLRERADEVVKLKPGNGQHRLAVELGVVESIQKMNPAGPGSGKTNSKLSCEFRVPACHKGCSLFVPHLDKTNLVLTGAERFHDPVDSIAWKTENNLYAPVQ